MSSSRVLEVQSTTVGSEGCLWAHSGRCHWWPLPSHLCRLTAASLSPGGVKTPSTLHSRFGSTADQSPTLFGAMQPLSPPRSMHEAPGRGAAVSLHLITAPRVHFWASPITIPPAACRSNTTHLQLGHNRNGCPHFLLPPSFPHTCCLPPRSFHLLNTFFISPPH
jgi:hypothetical protein